MAYCPNGHYYNAALHDSCPECAKSAGKTEAIGSAGASPRPRRSAAAIPGGFSETGGGSTPCATRTWSLSSPP